MKKALIKSKDRIRELGEVFTAEREVNAMLDLLPQEVWSTVEKTFLEPACGDGNFLEKILRRKLSLVPTKTELGSKRIEYKILCCVASIYGIDICDKNVTAAKQRLTQEVLDFWSKTYNIAYSEQFLPLLNKILDANIQCGNSLQPESLWITQWVTTMDGTFKPKVFQMIDLVQSSPQPIRENELITYFKEI